MIAGCKRLDIGVWMEGMECLVFERKNQGSDERERLWGWGFVEVLVMTADGQTAMRVK